jgi:hypothetical protein
MSRRTFLLAAGSLAAVSSLPRSLHAGENEAPLTAADRRRLEKSGPAATKMFIAALRTRFTADTADELREYIDPRYLKAHELQEGNFPVRTVLTNNIFDNQLSADPRTALIVALTETAAKEVFLFRLTVLDDAAYILPLAEPDKTTGAFDPWILRAKV